MEEVEAEPLLQIVHKFSILVMLRMVLCHMKRQSLAAGLGGIHRVGGFGLQMLNTAC